MNAEDIAVNMYFLCEGIRDAYDQVKRTGSYRYLYCAVSEGQGCDGFVRQWLVPLAKDLAAITDTAASLDMEFTGVWEYEVVSLIGYDYYTQVMGSGGDPLNRLNFGLAGGIDNPVMQRVKEYFGQSHQPCDFQTLWDKALLLRLKNY